MILSEMLDYLAQPIVDIFADDFDEAEYWQPDWLKNELQTAETPDLSDLFVTEQLETYEDDTNIVCEYSDLEDETGFGLITGWHHYPYVFSTDAIDTKENYAYILRSNGGSTYAHINSIRVIERVIGYETVNESELLPMLQSSTATKGQYQNEDMHELQHAATIGSSERAS